MGKGFFESDEDYADRTSKEAAEKAVEEHTGRAPSKGWFEDDKDYASRVRAEADEITIESNTGSAASKGWFEDESDYRARISEEADRAAVEAHSDTNASQGWFEDKHDYRARLEREANEALIEGSTGQRPSSGFFEDDSDYARRVRLQANEARAAGNRQRAAVSEYSSSSYSSSSYSPSSTSKPTGCLWIIGLLVIACVVRFCAWVGSLFYHSASTSAPPAISAPATSVQQANVLSTVNRWAAAHQANDINAEVAAYGATVAPFYGTRQATHAQVEQTFQSLSEKGVRLYVFGIENASVKMLSHHAAQVTFDRIWSTHPDAPPHCTRSQLKLAEVNGMWLIVGERDVH